MKAYLAASRLLHLFFGKKKLKLRFELLYWKVKKWQEKQLTNHHYAYFFTRYFGLSPDFYSRKKILDIGCGPRGSLEWANMAAERVGLDPLAEKYLRLGAGKQAMRYVKGGAENMPFPDGYFDVVSSFNSLDHVDNLAQSLSEISRVLAPGGLFLLISDIHHTPTICEPSAFGWDLPEKLKAEFRILDQKHFEGDKLYQSIRKGVAFDHQNPKKRYGVLTAKFQKKQSQ